MERHQQDKIISLTKYADDLRSRLKSPVPEKRKHAPQEYYEFLRRDLDKTERRISALKLSLPADLNAKK